MQRSITDASASCRRIERHQKQAIQVFLCSLFIFCLHYSACVPALKRFRAFCALLISSNECLENFFACSFVLTSDMHRKKREKAFLSSRLNGETDQCLLPHDFSFSFTSLIFFYAAQRDTFINIKAPFLLSGMLKLLQRELNNSSSEHHICSR